MISQIKSEYVIWRNEVLQKIDLIEMI